MKNKTLIDHLKHNDLFKCGLCKQKVGGGRVSLVTHAICWHNWKVKEIQEKAVYLGKTNQNTK